MQAVLEAPLQISHDAHHEGASVPCAGLPHNDDIGWNGCLRNRVVSYSKHPSSCDDVLRQMRLHAHVVTDNCNVCYVRATLRQWRVLGAVFKLVEEDVAACASLEQACRRLVQIYSQQAASHRQLALDVVEPLPARVRLCTTRRAPNVQHSGAVAGQKTVPPGGTEICPSNSSPAYQC